MQRHDHMSSSWFSGNTVGCKQWARRAKKRKGRLTKKVEKEEKENEEKLQWQEALLLQTA